MHKVLNFRKVCDINCLELIVYFFVTGIGIKFFYNIVILVNNSSIEKISQY